MRSLYWQVYELLSNSRVMDANDLYNMLKRRIPDIARRELDDVLLKLESAGFITVVQVSRDQRRIEFVEQRVEAAAQEQEEGAEETAPPANERVTSRTPAGCHRRGILQIVMLQ
ncbi:MAG: hypothetical protein ACP5G6_01265 [Conexivisphaera sp.]